MRLLLFPLALKALRRNLMRTMLTMLGVIIGVSAVICTIAIGEGASSKIQDAIASVGANVWVEAGGVNRSGVRTGSGQTKSLTLADMRAISATGQDQDDTFFMPYTTVMKKIKGQYWLDDIMMSAVSAAAIPAAEVQLAELLRARHRIREGTPDDFNLRCERGRATCWSGYYS